MNRSLKGVAVALVSAVAGLYLVACGSSSTTSPSGGPTPAPADVTITIASRNGNMSFAPTPGAVKVGQTVAWHNADGITHTATANGGAFDTGGISPGSTSAPVKMTAAGALGYHCSIHPDMVSTLNVTQ